MNTLRIFALAIVVSITFGTLTACHTSKKISNRRYMHTLHRELKRDLKDAEVYKKGDTVRVVYPELAMFDFGKDDIKKQALPSFQKFANILRDYCLVHAVINGYTDNVGTDDVNISLSKRRAENAKTLLETDGVGNTRMTTNGMGATNPVMTNATNEGRQANRRVEFVLYEGK